MRIAYVTEWDTGSEDGVLKKITEQIRSWLNEGHETKLFALSKTGKVWDGLRDLPKEFIFSPRVRYSIFRFKDIVKKVEHWKPDIVYLRSMMYYPSHEKLLNLPVVVEINTKEISEIKASSKLWAFYTLVTRGRILSRSRGIVAVTNEIAQDVKRFKQPTIVISNGVNIEAYPELPPATNLSPRLVFIGSVNARWHGLEKIIWLARYFREWHFDIIGPMTDLNINLDNMNTYGNLSKVEYMKIMAAADVAIGTLALHNKGMDEACPLKVREYLAFGIPTIIGYQDTDFPKPVPFVLQLPNMPNNVQTHVDRIKEFVLKWKGHRVARAQVLHLDNKIKEKQRLLFFKQLMEDK